MAQILRLRSVAKRNTCTVQQLEAVTGTAKQHTDTITQYFVLHSLTYTKYFNA